MNTLEKLVFWRLTILYILKSVVSFVGRENVPYPIVFILDSVESRFAQLNAYGGKYEPWQLVAGTAAIVYFGAKFYYYKLDLNKPLFEHLRSELFQIAKKIPYVANKIESELAATKESLEKSIVDTNKGTKFLTELPPFGMSEVKVMEKVQDYLTLSPIDWNGGKLSGCVYGADKNVNELVAKVYGKFAFANQMHADVFPEVRKMEAEVVRMVADLYHGDENSCGTMTSGGTESIMLACRAYREMAYKKGIRRPEMVVPQTAHAAFVKAGDYFRIRVHLVPVDPKTFKVSAKAMESYINSNTCMLAGSAPNFPNGAIDPIEDLSQLALKYKLPLHVDACLGGFLIPFMEDVGYYLPLFDFRLLGVTSISIDTHKYAYTPKGSSVILYRNPDYRKYQYFQCVDWAGGIYASPTFAGSRPGSLVAITWATLLSYGREGYLQATRDIIRTTNYIYDELCKIKHIYVLAKPEVSVIAFDSKDMNILNVYDELCARGWHLNAIQNPTGIHIAVTKLHTAEGVKEKFVSDLTESVEKVFNSPDKQMGKTAAIYCSSQSVPDPSLIGDCANLFLDACYSTKNTK